MFTTFVGEVKVYVADPTTVLYDDPSVLVWTDRVCVRVAQLLAGGRFSTRREMLCDEPRSTCHHCGNALLALSQ